MSSNIKPEDLEELTVDQNFSIGDAVYDKRAASS
jgi:hypothetical protein